MQLPQDIWQLRGAAESGPNVTVLGGTHGDELAGIEIVKKLLNKFQLSNKPSGIYDMPNISGNLFIGFGNPQAIKKKTRSASGLRDLNRSFIKKDFTDSEKINNIVDLKRARELAPLLENTDFLFDIHATSNPAPQFICIPDNTIDDNKYFKLMPIEKILADPHKIISQEYNLTEPGTTDYYVFKYGGSQWSKTKYGHKKALALCYETGYQSDLSKLDEIFFTIIRLINATGVINDKKFTEPAYLNFKPYTIQKTFKLSDCIKARYDGFTYEKNMDKGWQSVRSGQLLGVYSNNAPEYIRNDGMLLFPLSAGRVKKDTSLYWLAQEI